MLLLHGVFCVERSAAAKKNVRLLAMGPPTLPPHCSRSNCAFGSPCCAERKSSEFSSLLRKYPYPDPLKLLVPDLVTALTMPPTERPNSAAPPMFSTWNSAIASWLYFTFGYVNDSS